MAYPGAPALHNEMMTPIDESTDAPCSLITLGTLMDMGYTVNNGMANNFEPTRFDVRLPSYSNYQFFTYGGLKQATIQPEFKLYGYGGYKKFYDDATWLNPGLPHSIAIHFRRETYYNFYFPPELQTEYEVGKQACTSLRYAGIPQVSLLAINSMYNLSTQTYLNAGGTLQVQGGNIETTFTKNGKTYKKLNMCTILFRSSLPAGTVIAWFPLIGVSDCLDNPIATSDRMIPIFIKLM